MDENLDNANAGIVPPSEVECSVGFSDSDEDYDGPHVSLKDLKKESLREIARERKRIIENQVVRRKVLERWLSTEDEPPKFPEKLSVTHKKRGKLQVIQKHWQNMTAKFKPSASKPSSLGQRNCSLKSEDNLARPIGKYRMTSDLDLMTIKAELHTEPIKCFLPEDANNNPHSKNQNISNDSNTTKSYNSLVPTEEALLMQIGGGQMCINGNMGDCDSLVISQTDGTPLVGMMEKSGDTPHDSLEIEIGSIPAPRGFSEDVEETEILQTDNITEAVEITISAGESKTETITSSNSTNAKISKSVLKEVSVNNRNVTESVIEREIRMQKSREETLTCKRQFAAKEEHYLANTKTVLLSAIDEPVAVEDIEFVSHVDDVPNLDIPQKGSFLSKSQMAESSKKPIDLSVHENAESYNEVSGVVIQSMKSSINEYNESLPLMPASKPCENFETNREASPSSEKVHTTGIISTAKQLRQEKLLSEHQQSAESKIALEIREMREREEELKKMREKMTASNGNCGKSDQIDGRCQSGSSVRSDDSQDIEIFNGMESPQPQDLNSRSLRDLRDISRTVSLDSLSHGQNYNIGYVFAHRKKENIKVRPYTDEEEDQPNFKVLQESPVEREIRIAREREEELRKEKQMLLQSKQTINLDEKSKDTAMPLHIEVNGDNLLTVNGERENPANQDKPKSTQKHVTQRQLATTRIQQEIEEQTRREKALKASGQIQTISHERVDDGMTRFPPMSTSAVENAVLITTSSKKVVTETIPTETIPTETIPIETKKKSSLPVSTNSITLTKVNSVARPPSSATSSSSSSTKPLGPAVRRFVNPPPGKNVSMQRFIASKGKEISFSNGCTKSTVVGCFDYREIKPPQVRKGDHVIQKRSATAETKIQEELREMRAREEELKKQRARVIGLSQPNLTLLAIDDNLEGKSNGNSEELHPIERCSSNPNLLDVEESEEKPSVKAAAVGGPRRRSLLIDQWEQRIQKADIQV